MTSIFIEHEPIRIHTPYGEIYIEAAPFLTPELIVDIEANPNVQLCISKHDWNIDTSTTKPPKSVMPPIFDVEENQN
jgi:hypothetical protein